MQSWLQHEVTLDYQAVLKVQELNRSKNPPNLQLLAEQTARAAAEAGMTKRQKRRHRQKEKQKMEKLKNKKKNVTTGQE